MDAIKENKALVGVALVLALLVGVSAYTNRDSDASSDDNSQSETASKDDENSKKDEKKDESKDESNNDKKPEESESRKDDDKAMKEEKAKETEKSTNAPDEKDTKSEKSSDEDTSSRDKSYQYVAQLGDSYTVLSRKAVQTYGVIEGIKLSGAEIIAAETKLTQDAGAMMLNDGQSVDFDQSKVKSAISWAQDLSDADKAAWATYVPYVDFDTREYGE